MEKSSTGMVDTVVEVIEKLAGKGSNLTIRFEDLTLDFGQVKVTLNGAVSLDIARPKEADAPLTASMQETKASE